MSDAITAMRALPRHPDTVSQELWSHQDYRRKIIAIVADLAAMQMPRSFYVLADGTIGPPHELPPMPEPARELIRIESEQIAKLELELHDGIAYYRR